MCIDCGCGEGSETTIGGNPLNKGHHHEHSHGDHGHSHDHSHETKITANLSGTEKEISIKQAILHKNDHIAGHNREHLAGKGIFCMNWISAPGSGKTALLEKLITDYGKKNPIAVIEGDLQTDNDARRITEAGAKALQINTGAACHLDAEMIHAALHKIDLSDTHLLVIENVGNMVCPTAYDLGENMKLAVISCTEGEDKPIKYPDLLLTSKVLLINKTDLIPHLDFDLDQCVDFAKKVNPEIEIFPVSAKTGEGMDVFVAWLEKQMAK